VGEEMPFLGFVAAALLASWYGGAVMGVAALFVGLFLGEFFLGEQTGGFGTVSRSAEIVHYVRYVFTALLGVVLIDFQRRGILRTRKVVTELQREVALRKATEEQLRTAQEQLKRHTAELELRVAERTNNLQQSLQSLQDVLYHVAHDLRAPLRAMRGFTTLLTAQYAPRLDAQGLDYFRRISEAAVQMDGLIHDLLAYGRLGHTEISLSLVALRPVFDSVLHHLSDQIEQRRAEISLPADLPEVRAHEATLEQVLENLLENALKFVAPGTIPRIRIWSEQESGFVRLYVQDNGIGIEPKYQQRIFGIFERLHSEDVFPGTGIGLAIVAKGMQRMQGKVSVESQRGQGSRFCLEFAA